MSKPPPSPKRSVQVSFRTTPEFSDWLDSAATHAGRTRTDFIESWLRLAQEVHELQHDVENHDVEFASMSMIGDFFIGKMIKLGLATGLIADLWSMPLVERQNELEEVRRDLGTRKGLPHAG